MSTVFSTQRDSEAALHSVQQQFRAANPKSLARFEQACQAMPGGNTRSALHYEPFPLTMVRGEGAHLFDLDGRRYTDFVGDYTASLFGHSHPQLRRAMHEALDDGLTLGAPNRYDATLATLICERFASVQRLRFTNSGTEANLMALTAARAFTGREKILVFRDGYHGGVLTFSGDAARHNAPYPVVLADYNDTDGTSRLIDTHAGSLAAVLVEPMLGTGGAIPARVEFLRMLRARCQQHGIVLIFDEVMTSRLSAGGMQQLTGVTPDMTTFGKYLGGGGTFGAFGGAGAIMEQFDPRRAGSIGHAGTFNNNVMTMAAGVTGLRDIYTAPVADQHTARGEQFKKDVNGLAQRHQWPLQMTGVGSILHLHWQREPIVSPADIRPADPTLPKIVHLAMLQRGYYFSQKGFITLSLPLVSADYDGFLSALEKSVSETSGLM